MIKLLIIVLYNLIKLKIFFNSILTPICIKIIFIIKLSKKMHQSSVQKIIGINFKDKLLLQQALSHTSYTATRKDSYENLELLGDRVLGLVIVEKLYNDFPNYNDGQLSKAMNMLTCGETLFEIYQTLNLKKYVLLSPSEAKNQGAIKPSIGAAVIEAIIGAIYLDQSLNEAKIFINNHWLSYFNKDNLVGNDIKSKLQAYVQSLGHPVPAYEITKQTGPDHMPVIEVKVSIPKTKFAAMAKGSSKKQAQKIAAKTLYDQLLTEIKM